MIVKKDWYFIKLVPSGTKTKATCLSHYLGTIYGYTESHWIASKYLQSLKELSKGDNDSLFSTIPCDVIMVHFYGTLSSFHEMMKKTYGHVITGEDILEVFNSGEHTYPVLPDSPVSIISTCGDIVGGKLTYMVENCLLDSDCRKLYWVLCLLTKSLNVGIFRQYEEIILNFIAILMSHPLMERYFLMEMHNDEYYGSGSLGMMVDYFVDIVRYGILKGRFLPL